MAKTEKSIKEPKCIDFHKWVLSIDNRELKDTVNMLQPIKKYLPNFESFIFWYYEISISNSGFYTKLEDVFFDYSYLDDEETTKETFFSTKNHIDIFNLNINDIFINDEKTRLKNKADFIDKLKREKLSNIEKYIDEFNEKINFYNEQEQVIYTKILIADLQYFESFSRKDNNRTEKIKSKEYAHIIKKANFFINLNDYFELKYNNLNVSLPFEIIDKNTDIEILDDPFPNLNWYIEEMKETPTQPTPAQNEISRKDKIKWNKQTSLLAYLFYKLETEKIIIGGTIPANLAQIFTDNKYKDIKPKSIQKAITDYKGNVKAQGKEQIDEIIELIKEISQKLD